MTATMRWRDGTEVPLQVGRWCAPATVAERALLDTVRGPVIDIGCGPGRLAAALSERGVPTLGIDASTAAVRLATSQGAAALCRSVFEPLPRERAWATALLFDGNIGIGGDPRRMLRRVRQLLRVTGRALVEADTHGVGHTVEEVHVENGGVRSPWFAWARLDAPSIAALAPLADLAVVTCHEVDGRLILELEAR